MSDSAVRTPGMDAKRKSGSGRGKSGGGKKKKSKAEDSAAQKLHATLSEALAVLEWEDAADADLETALLQLGPCAHQLLQSKKKGPAGTLGEPMQQQLLCAIEKACANPEPRVCGAAWKAFRELSLLDAELCELAIERGLTAVALSQLRATPTAPSDAPTKEAAEAAAEAAAELRLCALGVLWNLSEACPAALRCFGAATQFNPTLRPCILQPCVVVAAALCTQAAALRPCGLGTLTP